MNDKIFPLVTFEWAEDGIWGYVYRIGILALIGWVCYMAVTDTESVLDIKDSGFGAINDAFEWGRLKLDNRSTTKVKTDSERMMDDLFGADTDDDDEQESGEANKENVKESKKVNDKAEDADEDDVELDYDRQ